VVGDQIRAADPQTGVSAAWPVAALIRHGGQHAMADVSLSDGSVVYATAGHPFWDVSAGAFVTAGELPVGDQVLTAGGARLSVTAVVLHEQDLIAYNLSIEDIHTYYAGDAAVLVHNTGAACPRTLYRNGIEAESAESLARQSSDAAAAGFPHGVSAFSKSSRPDAMVANGTDVAELFQIVKTGKNEFHFTIELPNPVTQEVADAFNALFGRSR
jgi:hypothetical protein